MKAAKITFRLENSLLDNFMAIKNIVFDVGNVLVRWDPVLVIQTVFPDMQDPLILMQKIFKVGFWYDLNLGKISEKEAIQKYHIALNIDKNALEQLMLAVKESLVPVEGSIELVERLHRMGFPLYVITDNTQEIMQHLRQKYDFWHMFQGVVVSAEIGHLKPSPLIYRHLLESYQLKPEETLFLDDVPANVEGALAVNMFSIQFTDVSKCIEDLKNFNIQL